MSVTRSIRTSSHGIRITGGNLKGKTISVSEDNDARYTSSKVREALFNTLGSVEGMSILDLFAGSGSFSVEAISRGAASVTCVENDPGRVTILRSNMESLFLNSYCQVLDMDVRYAVPFLSGRNAVYDMIFMDPPYEKGHVAETLSLFEKHVIYRRDTMVVIEYSKRETIAFSDFQKPVPVKTKRYGDTTVTILTFE